jgi:gephyrin
MIRDSNRPSLLSLIRGWGLCEQVVDLEVARDTPNSELEEKIRDGFRSHDLDVIVTTGGVSMGELDLLKPTIERSMGGTVHFGRVSMKPGKPTTFASVPFKESKSGDKAERLIFGLPGNPASAIVTANLFLLPCLQRMNGLEGRGMEEVVVWTTSKIRCDKARVEYHRVVVGVDEKDGTLVARSTGMQRSSRVGSLASANALLVLPQKEGFVESGESCEALLMGPILGF